MRSETNRMRLEDQGRSKTYNADKRKRSTSPSQHSNQRRSSLSDDDLSDQFRTTVQVSTIDNEDDDENCGEEGEDYVSDT